ncbi:MAG: serine protease, partial [Acidobacteriota bacterium]|nr:serine protease [Acidobacteriota bacterium]
MRHACVLAALVLVPGFAPGQEPGLLRVTVTLRAEQTATPVPRHALLISDNPATREPRRVLTRADGTVEVRLPPGSYTVESDRPILFLGKAYQWTQMVDVAAGRDTTLQLTADNADIVSATIAASESRPAAPESDPSLLLAKWQDSVAAVWSPTSRASGFVIDARGLIATNRTAVGDATSVEVQLSESVKVPARVLFSEPANAAAIVWVEPSLVAGRTPLPLDCPPARAASLDEGDEIVTIGSPLRRPTDSTSGEVTGFLPRGIETDLRLGFGATGGPVFNAAGAVVGLTSIQADDDASRVAEVTVVRVVSICEAASAARARVSSEAPPEATHLPIDPLRSFPADGLVSPTPTGAGTTTPLAASSSDFDVAFITPPMVLRARQRSDWTGGAGARSLEAEARLGRLTEFGAWSEYFVDAPPVVVVRVTPKLVEGFWKRLAREAARTQGAQLPPFKDFKTSFLHMRASCGGTELTPIHPFVLEHRVSEKDSVREGLYVFDANAFGPQCGQ